MKANPVTDSSCNDQLLYFTSSSLTKDNKTLIFISDRTGNPNIFAKDLATGLERQLTLNQEGTLKSYVYFYGSSEKGLGKASISFDAKRGIVYYIQGKDICCTDLDGNVRKLNQLPAGQVTAFTAISTNGKKLCVPTTDERALDTGNTSSNNITDNPDYDVDARVQNEHLNSYLRVYDTATGEETLCEKVEHAWITHVQFCPTDPNLILYNHEWPADCGIRRMWLFDGKNHRRLRQEREGFRKEDWTCHEMWQPNGKYIIYHGKYKDETPYIGRVSISGNDNCEIPLNTNCNRYGHFTVGNVHDNWLVSDGYYHPENVPEDGNWAGEWISVQKVDWENKQITWLPLCKHHSLWDCQDSHPHPIFDHSDCTVYFTANNRKGMRTIYSVSLP